MAVVVSPCTCFPKLFSEISAPCKWFQKVRPKWKRVVANQDPPFQLIWLVPSKCYGRRGFGGDLRILDPPERAYIDVLEVAVCVGRNKQDRTRFSFVIVIVKAGTLWEFDVHMLPTATVPQGPSSCATDPKIRWKKHLKPRFPQKVLSKVRKNGHCEHPSDPAYNWMFKKQLIWRLPCL